MAPIARVSTLSASLCRAGKRHLLLGAHDDHRVTPALPTPHLAWRAAELCHTRWPRDRDRGERLGGRIEQHEIVQATRAAERGVAQPDPVALVHVDGVRAWLGARQAPLPPLAGGGIVAAQ